MKLICICTILCALVLETLSAEFGYAKEVRREGCLSKSDRTHLMKCFSSKPSYSKILHDLKVMLDMSPTMVPYPTACSLTSINQIKGIYNCISSLGEHGYAKEVQTWSSSAWIRSVTEVGEGCITETEKSHLMQCFPSGKPSYDTILAFLQGPLGCSAGMSITTVSSGACSLSNTLCECLRRIGKEAYNNVPTWPSSDTVEGIREGGGQIMSASEIANLLVKYRKHTPIHTHTHM